MALQYNAPQDGSKSSIDGTGSDQMNQFKWIRKAIIQSRREQYLMPMASKIGMPKHFGKTIKVYETVPLLDDRNSNDQGLDAAGASYADGNLYGSSKDVGTIVAKLPALAEGGGRVNRVGFTRLEREATISELGFFYEFTKDSIDFDSDSDLKNQLATELLNGAVEMTEDVLGVDLLTAPGVTVYSGAAAADIEVTGETVPEVVGVSPEIPASVVSYEDIQRLDQILTENRTPMQTKVFNGSRFTDTKTLPAARVILVGSELVPHLKRIKDPFGNQAFVAVQHYATSGDILNGEIGRIDNFRIVQVPEMLHWAGAGAAVSDNPGYRETGGNYDIFPMLCLGEDSWTCVSFQNDGMSGNFNIVTKMPGSETASSYNDPYGKMGFSSIAWWYGTLIKRPERIGVIKTVATL